MTKTIFRGLVLVLVFGGICCSIHHRMHRVTIENFSLIIPEEAQLVKQSSMEDFDVYRCSVAGATILSFYVGNAPSFPHRKAPSEVTEHTRMGMPVRDLKFGKEHKLSRETLFEVSHRTWPRFVHFWYHDLGKGNGETADRIINSINPKGRQIMKGEYP